MKHIFFDLDGTLIDSAPSILACLARALEQRGIPLACGLDRSLIGPPLSETLKKISGVSDPTRIEELASEFKRYYDEEGFKETREYPQITEILRYLSSRNPIFIVTNKRIGPTRKILRMFDWDRFFVGVYGPDSFQPAMTSKIQVLMRVKEIHGIDTDNALYVGDRTEDWEAAKQAGFQFLGVEWGYGTWTHFDEGAVTTVSSSTGLRRFIERG
jgi:phosphoglycolate phosphatase